ncbi:MAG TPA: hypothetical protein VH092_30505 [Urbifossiella sp.]|jgi:hypothetical protein|nr:hypothetical protein [Urbifossiella sp.]
MFRGDAAVTFTTAKPDAEVATGVAEALAPLGRVKIDKKGIIEIEPAAKLTSFLTDVTVEGTLRKKAGGGYEVVIEFDCKPTLANWLIAGFGTLFLCVGFVVVFVPLGDKKKVGKAVRGALRDVEDELAGD